MLRRPGDRMQGLAELAALAEALGDARLGIDVRLRRAAAMRTAEEYERAAELAREVRDLAVERGDREGELAACMELGQDLMHATAGESFTPAAKEVDLDACDEAFRRAMELAQELGDVAAEAAATREVGVVAARPGARVVHRAGRAGPASADRAARGGGRGPGGHHAGAADRARVHGDVRSPPARARALRAARGPARRDVHDHRARLPELGARHPSRHELGATHRGDPPAHVQDEGVHERERARGVRGADALRLARVRAREGDPRPGAREGPGGPPLREGDRRSEPRVPGGRRDRDGASSTSATSTRPGRGSTVPRRSPPSIRARSARAGSRRGGGSRTRPRATPRGCAHTWSAPCSRRPTRASRPRDARRSRAWRSSPRGWACGAGDEELMALAERSAVEASELVRDAARSRPVGRPGRRGARARRARPRERR